jgi:Protein of unknown function (DUF2961)/HEAT repeats
MQKVAVSALAACLGASALAAQPAITGPIDPMAFSQLKDFTAHRSSSNYPEPDWNDDSKHPLPAETVTIADLSGPGIVTHIWTTLSGTEYGWPRLMRLRVYYDGSDVPSVDVPLGDFFAVGHGFERPIRSLMIRNLSDGRARNSYWPMPFEKSCRITITNEGKRRVGLYYHVDWERVPSLPPNTAYFHARYRQALPAPADGKPWVFLDTTGRGFYVGTVLSVLQAEPGWFGEGDDMFYVDGERVASIQGTGSEDYFNDAWGLHVAEGEYTGSPISEGEGLGARMTAYRWHLVDPIPFTKSLRAEIEHKGWTYRPDGKVKTAFGERSDLMSSVAYWYQKGIATDQPPVPYGSARLPHGNARQIEVEDALADVQGEKGKVSVSKELFWGKDVLLFQGEGPGSRVSIPFTVEEDGLYELVTQVAQAPDYGVYEIELDGGPVAARELEHEPGADIRQQTRFDGYAYDTYVGLDRQIGWLTLPRGRHTLTFVCLGKNPASSGYTLGVDNIILARAGAAGWALAASAKEPVFDPKNVAGFEAALSSPDPRVRTLAALALGGQPEAALRALPVLEKALSDADPSVREAAARAIEAQGPRAAAAVPALVAACKAPGQTGAVLRACLYALGHIGKAAAPALPTMRALLAEPSSGWVAEKAIRDVESATR